MVTVAMVAKMRNNPTKQTMLKVAMSMMTTTNTVLHWNFETGWSSVPFSSKQVACVHSLLWSSRRFCLLLDGVA